MDNYPVIRFDSVSVRYRVPRERISGIKEFAIRWLQRRVEYEDFWALRNVSFEVGRGEMFGVIGHNGAGKSTLLKVMARVLKPVEGRVVMSGNVAPLLELGGGFHPELTGRENIFLNMALLGHTRQTTAALFDSIVDFAEISEFIDAPIRTYSTGMGARLGFAVATCIRPDILLVDEVLSVGDSKFQQKCLDRMYDFQQQGSTIVIVSHGMGTIETFCKRALLLEKGRVSDLGSVDKVIQKYIQSDQPAREPLPVSASQNQALEPKFIPEPAREGDHALLDQVGGIYPAAEIFDVQQGTLAVWIKLIISASPQNAIIFHTDDSRYVLYQSVYFSNRQKRYIRQLVARAGGNHRAVDTYYGTSGFPEISITIEDDFAPKKFILEADTWHLVTLTWHGFPDGELCLYIDGILIGDRKYDQRYNRADELPAQIAIGLRPSMWMGEIVVNEDGTVTELRPGSMMPVTEGGIEIADLQLYQRVLSVNQIQELAQAPGKQK